MNGWRAIVAAIATWLLGLGDGRGAEKLLVARGAGVVSLQCGEVRLDELLKRQVNGVSVGEWKVAPDCVARLEMVRARRPEGISDVELSVLRLTLTNRSTEPCVVPVIVRLRPSSLTGPALGALAFERHAFFIEGQPILVADTPARGAILAESAFAPRPLTPESVAHVTSPTGECRGEMVFDLTLAPGQTQVLGFLAARPVADSPEVAVTFDFLRSLRIDELFPVP